uniref:Cytochrome P450 n=1 Tax=Kalanchoe fedtschenkoi TaxID=63787 RepID=A0A7N1A6X0_KALFE
MPHCNIAHERQAENIALREKKKGEFITSEDVSSLKYTNMVVEETLRMANTSGTVFRIATRDVEYKGYKFPQGWRVIPWLRYSHTNPEYFEDPLRFNPDRWNVPAKPGTYQAFGGGPRICPGNMFAKMIAAIFIHHLTVGYKWDLVNPDAKIDYLPHPKPSDLAEVTFSRL